MIEYSSQSLSIGHSASLLGVSVVTLRRWNKLGKLTSFRTFGNHRRFHLNDILNIINPSLNQLHVAYARVSSHDQKKDLETQSKRLELIIEQYEHKMLISDLGSGLNYNKSGLKKLINLIVNSKVHTLYLTHKDRLLRFGSELIFSLCKKFGTKVIIVDAVQSISFEQELAQDVIELMTVFSAKLYGKRSHKNKKSNNHLTFNSFLVIIMALLSIYLSMKKKPNIKELFGPTLDDDVALNNAITVQAKFKLCPEQDLILNKIMECLTHAKLMYFNYLIYSTKMNKFMKEHALYITKEVKVKDKVTGLTSSNSVTSLESFKVVFCRFYGLSSRQFNSIDFVIKGLIKANKTLMKDRLINFNDQLDKKLAKQKKLVGDLHLLSISDGFKTKKQDLISSHNKKKTALIKLKEEIEKKQEAIIRLENNIKTDKISVCFGDRKILNRLSSLFNDSNYDHGKYKHLTNDARKSYHTAYRKLWNDSRFNQFFLLGSKDENNGNASCVFSKQSESLYSVKISIPQCVKDELNLTQKYLVINNINFKHNEKEILNSFALNEQRKQKETEFTQKLKDKDPSLFDDKGEAISKADYLADEGVAISFRFIKDTFADPKRVSSSWRILTSMDETKHQKAIVSKATGVIAIDTNVDHFAVAELNSQRELKKAFNLYFGFTDSEQNSNKTLRKEAILKSAKEIIKYAIETKKPIVIERLDFKTKRAALKEENTLFGDAAKRKNRILSSFAYSLMIETIKTLAYRNGIAVYEVNPAFTSQIGWLKYAKKYGISRHMAAAYVIGRRTYAIEELFDRNEQVIVKNQIGAVPLLVDRDDCKTYFEYCSKNLRNFLKRQVHESRGKLNSTQVSSGSVVTI